MVGQLSSNLDTEIRLDTNSNNINNKENIYDIIQLEFGRPLSPMEIEVINTWDYPLEILKEAVKEAVLSATFSIKYVDRIIFNWKKANVKTLNDVKQYIKKFHEKKEKKSSLIASESIADYYGEL